MASSLPNTTGASSRLMDSLRRRAREQPLTPAAFAARHLGVAPSLVFSASEDLTGHQHTLVGRTLAQILEHVDGCVPGPAEDESEPAWRLLELNHRTELIPASASLAMPAGALAPVPLVVRLTAGWRSRVEVLAPLDHAWTAHQVLADLVRRARRETNPFRGQVVRADHPDDELELTITDPPTASRADVHLPDGLWSTIDRNIHRVVADAERLIGAGLGANRGVLLVGPPGTGKTAVSRVVAAELAGTATVVLCSPQAASYAIEELYRQIVDLAPALVVIEDLDLIVGDRHRFGSGNLQQFLVALDGVATTSACIVTLASTNDLGAIDAAARRAARFDVVLEVPRPDHDGRERILARYLRGIDHDVDVRVVAHASQGASAADLRELVRRAVIEGDERPATATLVAAATAGTWRASREGMYL